MEIENGRVKTENGREGGQNAGNDETQDDDRDRASATIYRSSMTIDH